MRSFRFTKGSQVEVWSDKEGPRGSWLCAEIVSGDGRTYSVKYGCLPMTKEVVKHRVPRKALRPCPPPLEGAGNCNWMPGCVVEVFQNLSWKAAMVMKNLNGNRFSVRVLGSSSEFEVPKSHMRVQQSWEVGQWSIVVGKGSKNFGCKGTTLRSMMDSAGDNSRMHMGALLSDSDSCSCASSVASCSGRETDVRDQSLRYTTNYCDENSQDCCIDAESNSEDYSSDAESHYDGQYEEDSCGESTNVKYDQEPEIAAYRKAIKALFDCGPLTWEEEEKLTNLRLALHISNDEHSLVLKNLRYSDGRFNSLSCNEAMIMQL